MQKISYRAAKDNCKLTDFEPTKMLVLNNVVRNVPNMQKTKSRDSDSMLNSFF